MLQHYRSGDTLAVRLGGELDHFCAQRVRRDLDTLLEDPGVHTLVLDFGALTFMDSSGIGVLLSAVFVLLYQGALTLLASLLGVINMNPHIGRIFHMSGLDRVIAQLDKEKQEAHS